MTRTSEARSGARAPRKLRVMHIAPMMFGVRFSGHTHYLFSLLSGWRDEEVALDLWGSSVRPLNMASGNTDYRLPTQLWRSSGRRRTRIARLAEYARPLAFVMLHAGSFDVAHFHSLGWGNLMSPLLLHLLGKKAVFNATLYGSDNPSAVRQSRGGRWAGRLLRCFDGILTISPLLADDYLAAGFRNVACIPHFLALPQLEQGRDAAARAKVRGECSIPPDATVLLFVGSVIRRKGVDLLAESFARLASRHHDLWLILVGPRSRAESAEVDEEFVRAVRERMDRAGVASRVVWTGTLRDKSALVQWYSAADVFVFPTRAEGLGNVLIEASAAGLPSVATNLEGVTDIVVADGRTGFLFPVENIDALTQAVERLVAGPALREEMGRAARVHAKRFGFDEYRRHLKAFYLGVAGLSPCRAQMSPSSDGRAVW